MKLPVESYTEQERIWPLSGRHILASQDDETVVVYQAYRPAIGRYAVAHGRFGGEFRYNRMSWIKPNFLWMMYRSDWGKAEGQEVVLAVRLRRTFFDLLLGQAVPSTFDSGLFPDKEAWLEAVRNSDVRLQWDPDHLPDGTPCSRRAVQVGLRGEALDAYGKPEVVEVIDMTEFVREQRIKLVEGAVAELLVPVERVYRPPTEIADRIRLDES